MLQQHIRSTTSSCADMTSFFHGSISSPSPYTSHTSHTPQTPHKSLASTPLNVIFFFVLITLLFSYTPGLHAQEVGRPFSIGNATTIRINSSVIAHLNVPITMRDGININVDIYRPSRSGQHPALYASAPYPHNGDTNAPDNIHTGPVIWFVEQGYVYVLASSRGTALSEGNYEFLSRDEQQDHYEIVEWIAEQSWSNSKVAGVGGSYYATSQWLMAIQSPPHLECIAPLNGVLDPYRDWAYPGGINNLAFSQGWYEHKLRQENAFPVSGPSRIVNYDLRLHLLLHPYYDQYWQTRSAAENIDRISIPVFMLRSWNLQEPGLNSTLSALSQLNSTNKIILFDDNGEDSNPYQNEAFLREELLPFYDWCLNDSNSTSFIEKPRIRYNLGDSEILKKEINWPPGNIENTAMYLNKLPTGGVATTTLNFNSLPGSLINTAFGSGTERNTVRFSSEALEQDMEVAGAIMLELYASSTALDTAFKVTLYEQPANPQQTPIQFFSNFQNSEDSANTSPTNTPESDLIAVSNGQLLASARTTDPDLSLPQQPYYLNSYSSPLIPGQVTRFDIAMQHTTYRFSEGSRIILEISKISGETLTNKSSRDTFYHSNNYSSRLWLPLVKTPAPNFSPPSVAATVEIPVDSVN